MGLDVGDLDGEQPTVHRHRTRCGSDLGLHDGSDIRPNRRNVDARFVQQLGVNCAAVAFLGIALGVPDGCSNMDADVNGKGFR